VDDEEDVSAADLSEDLPALFVCAAVFFVVLFDFEGVFEDLEGVLEGPVVFFAVELRFFGVPVMRHNPLPERDVFSYYENIGTDHEKQEKGTVGTPGSSAEERYKRANFFVFSHS
jgi:hypothetical protein